MRARVMAAAAVAALLAAGCGEARRRLAAAEEAQRAAEKRARDLRESRAALAKELTELRAKTGEARAKARAAKEELRRTLAAAGTLEAAAPGAFPGVDAAQALAAEHFEEAGGDLSKIASAVGEAVREFWPCAEAAGGQEGAPSCDSSPYEDACAGVPEYDSPVLQWSCSKVIKAADAPALAFCTAPISSRELRGPVAFTSTEALVRTAFYYGGRVVVSDWPEPSLTTYHPRNEDGLSACRSEDDRRSCTHQCDVRFGRYSDPCAPSYGCGGCGDHGDGEEPPGDEDEDPQVAAARAEARRAEMEAAEALERARMAREEVQYQECLSGCEHQFQAPEVSAETSDDLPPAPDSTTATVRLAKSPAPGVLVVEEDRVTRAGEEAVEVATRTVLLQDDSLAGARTGFLIDSPAKVGSLRVLDSFQDARTPGVARAWKLKKEPVPGSALAFATLEGKPALAGVREDGTPAAWSFSPARRDPPSNPVDPSVLCASVASAPSAFGAAAKDLAAACERAAKAAEEAAALKERIGGLESLPALKEWKAALDASKTLTAEQKRPLQAAFDERRRDVVKGEVARLLERLQGIEEGESLAEWDKARILEGATPEQVSALQKAFRQKEDALRNAGTVRARKAAGAPDASAGAGAADAGGAR